MSITLTYRINLDQALEAQSWILCPISRAVNIHAHSLKMKFYHCKMSANVHHREGEETIIYFVLSMAYSTSRNFIIKTVPVAKIIYGSINVVNYAKYTASQSVYD